MITQLVAMIFEIFIKIIFLDGTLKLTCSFSQGISNQSLIKGIGQIIIIIFFLSSLLSSTRLQRRFFKTFALQNNFLNLIKIKIQRSIIKFSFSFFQSYFGLFFWVIVTREAGIFFSYQGSTSPNRASITTQFFQQ